MTATTQTPIDPYSVRDYRPQTPELPSSLDGQQTAINDQLRERNDDEQFPSLVVFNVMCADIPARICGTLEGPRWSIKWTAQRCRVWHSAGLLPSRFDLENPRTVFAEYEVTEA